MTQFPTRARVCIAGAGAIGCTLAARLAAAGHEVSVLARGKTLDILRQQALRLDDATGQTAVHVQAESEPNFGVQDIIFACSKSQDLPTLFESLDPLIGPDTLIVPTPNGVPFWYFHRAGGRFEGRSVHAVDPHGLLARHVPLAQVIGAVVFITAEVISPGHVVSRTPHLVMLGEPSGEMTPRLLWLRSVLEGAGIEARALARIRDKLWTKIIANLTSNPLSVVSGATLQEIYSDPTLLSSVRQVMHEAMLTACSHGVRLEIDPIEFIALGAAMGPIRTSMLQDYTRGRPLELAAIGDAVIELAEHYSLPMPATRALLDLARSRGEVRQQQLA
jgi:2-dehydropantoate 2-reductase